MRVIDPGHKFELDQLDGAGKEVITYVKREGVGYPGNVGHYPGTNLQENLRGMISRFQYLDNQEHDESNIACILYARVMLLILERRAAIRHNRQLGEFDISEPIEDLPTCSRCGHIGHVCVTQ